MDSVRSTCRRCGGLASETKKTKIKYNPAHRGVRVTIKVYCNNCKYKSREVTVYTPASMAVEGHIPF